MFRVCARNYHSYTHLTLGLGILRKLTVWGFMTSKYSCTHDTGLATLPWVAWPPRCGVAAAALLDGSALADDQVTASPL